MAKQIETKEAKKILELEKTVNLLMEKIDKKPTSDLQAFMDDMGKLGSEVKDVDLIKPDFNFDSLTVTNYLLWKILKGKK